MAGSDTRSPRSCTREGCRRRSRMRPEPRSRRQICTARARLAPICARFIAGTDMPETLPPGVLNIRMYRVGFGDSFLLSFPVGDGHRHVLVDCGAHAKGTLGNLEKVAQNISDVTGQRLAAIVATHRHQDHIWGFERGRDVFRQMEIGEVWLPWVEED